MTFTVFVDTFDFSLDVKYEIDDITHKLLILDPISLTWKYARSELWRQQNSNIACKELNMTTSLGN